MPIMTATEPTPEQVRRSPAAVRLFGPYQLLRLLGKSRYCMAWLVMDTRSEQETLLLLPREALAPEDHTVWADSLRRSQRLQHPALLAPHEAGVLEQRPFLAYPRGDWTLLSERIGKAGIAALELVQWMSHATQGLAFAHEGGMAHHDVQPWMIVTHDNGQAALLGMGLAERASLAAQQVDMGTFDERAALRKASVRDVLSLGLCMHHALACTPPLDEPDVGKVVERLAPVGGEWVRLPFDVPRPIADGLRAIVNRATDRQPRQRYQNARTLQGALDGWLQTHRDNAGGPIELLRERIRFGGTLPAQDGAADRVARLALFADQHTSVLAEIVLEDIALTFELLRVVNGTQVHGATVAAGGGPVLMVRRALAMIGTEGARAAALSLRAWPGTMGAQAEAQMKALVERTKLTAQVAVTLAPAGYDGEVVALISHLQHLGWLLVQYHFSEQADQIRALMHAAEPTTPGEAPQPGMSQAAASFAVLGEDIQALGNAMAMQWGFGDEVLAMMQPVPRDVPVRHPQSDAAILRCCASCAAELMDACEQAMERRQAAVHAVALRYGRALQLTAVQMEAALPAALLAWRSATSTKAAA